MAKEFSKIYTMTVKYSRDDGEALADTDLEATELRKHIKKAVGEVVPISRGILSAHIVGSVSES